MPVFVITGANRGLGLTFVIHLAIDPANTIIATTRSLSSDLHALESQKSKGATLHILPCDASSLGSIDDFAGQVSSLIGPDAKIDYLINNAGINSQPNQTSLTLSAEALIEQMTVNVLGPAKTVQSLVNHLQKGSVIMNMSSMLGSLAYNRTKQVAESTPYSISKASVNMLSVHQASHLAEAGVIVICMDPGWVQTSMGGVKAPLQPDESIAGMLKCLKGLTIKDSGKFYVYDGREKAW